MLRHTHNLLEGEVHPADKSMRYIRTVRVKAGGEDPHNTTTGSSNATINSEENSTMLLHTSSAKAHKALDVIGDKITENAKIATFEEMKISTEILLGITMD